MLYSWSVTYVAEGKLRPTSGLTESSSVLQACAGHALGCSEQQGLGPCSKGWFPGGGARLLVMSRLC